MFTKLRANPESLAVAVLFLLLGLVMTPGRSANAFGADLSLPGLPEGLVLFRLVLLVIGAYALILPWVLPQPQPGAQGRPVPWQISEILVLSLLLIVATALRFYRLGEGIWFDEIATQLTYIALPPGQIVTSFGDANNHIFYSFLGRLSVDLFGDSTWAIRLPAALFGVAGIWAFYLLARRLTGQTEALFGAALMTFSFHHIWFSQNARGYTVLIFFAILSTVFLLDAMKTERARTWLFFALAAFFGAWTHLTMAFPVLAQFVVFLIAMRRRPADMARGLLLGFVPLGLLTVLALSPVLTQIASGGLLDSGSKGADSAWVNPIWALVEFLTVMAKGFGGTAIIVGLLGGVVVALGTVDFVRNRWEVPVLFYVSTLSALILMLSIGYTLFPRFFIYAIAFAVLTLMRGASVSAALLGRAVGLGLSGQHALAAAACGGLVLLSMASLRHVHAPKQAFDAALGYLEAELKEGDRVAALGVSGYVFIDYFGRDFAQVETADEVRAGQGEGANWLVYTFPVAAEPAYPDVMKLLDQDYEIAEIFGGTLSGGEVVLAVKRGP